MYIRGDDLILRIPVFKKENTKTTVSHVNTPVSSTIQLLDYSITQLDYSWFIKEIYKWKF